MKSLCLAVLVSFTSLTPQQEAPLKVGVQSDAAGVAADLLALLKARGVAAREAAVDAAGLRDLDVLVLHRAGFTALPAESRAALEAFAARGGGLVLLGGAVAAGAPEWWTPLSGGAWSAKSRSFSSVMTLYVAGGQHPIVHDAFPFDRTDVTAYDLDLAESIQVMGSAFTPKITNTRSDRREQAERASIYDLQPQLWAYEGKAHRAVVQIQGGNAPLQHASLRVFALRGLQWAARRANLDALCKPEELASLRYPDGGPSRAEDTVKKMDVHPEFTVSVVACEPLVNKPIAIQWDERGRLWVAETPEYPNGRRPSVAESWKETGTLVPGKYDRPAMDRISILTDTDGDGKMDAKSVFYEGLELVTGFCFYGDGVLALTQPDLLWIRDTDGDGKAETVVRVLTGFKPGDSHFVANHLMPGYDGWIYASMGGNEEIKTPDGKTSLGRASSGMFRFKPDGSALEQVSSKGGNGFGAHVTSDFELFFGQATSGSPIQHVVVPEWTLAAGRLKTLFGANSVIDGRKVVVPKLPDRVPLMQIDVVGGYSAACGSLVYEGGAWPEAWNRSVFCSEAILNVIHHEIPRPAGATLAGDMVRKDAEFIHSNDYWFRPIEVAPGPDGAIYILDFYSSVIAHSDTRGPKHSRAGASVRPDRDHYFGRIYRVQHKEARKNAVPDLAKAEGPALVDALQHPNDVVRANAFRLITEKKDAATTAALVKATTSASASARIAALWALYRRGAATAELLRAALAAPTAEVRKNAALIAEAGGGDAVAAELVAGLEDADPRARLAMFRGLAKTKGSEVAARKLLALYGGLQDDWTRTAAVAAAAADPALVLAAALKTETTPAQQPFLSAVSQRAAEKGDASTFGPLIVSAAASGGEETKVVILTAAAGLASAPPDSPDLQAALKSLLAAANPRVSTAALPVAAAWGTSEALKAEIAARITESLGRVENAALPDAARMEAVTALVGARKANLSILSSLGKLLSGPASPALKRHLITALGTTGDPKVAALVLEALPKLDSTAQDAALTLLLSRREGVTAVLNGVEAKTLALSDLGPNNVYRLRTHPEKDLAARAVKLFDAIRKPSTNKDALIAGLLPQVAKGGSSDKGREVFVKNCQPCHKFNDLGNQVGPVLTGMGAHGRELLLTNILDPNRAVDAGYEAWNVLTKSGVVLSGILAQENDAQLTLKSAQGIIEIPKSTIEQAKKSSLSLMPEGLEAVGVEAIRDLLAFLTEGADRFRVLDLSGAFTADTRRGLFASVESVNDTVKFATFGIVQANGIPFNIVDPSKSTLSGNVVVLRGGSGKEPAHQYPDRVEVKVGVPVKALHLLGGVAGWGASRAYEGPTILTVQLRFEGGETETVELTNGVHFVDYVATALEVPGSKRAEGLVQEHQIRVITIPVTKTAALQRIVLSSPGNGTTGVTAAITAELAP
jgi:putative membrane-bound dehydrogenase-like protein